MNRYQKDLAYTISLGFLFAILITVFIYRQPAYHVDIVQSDFRLINRDGLNLGWVVSTISLSYKPNTNLGTFHILIKTDVEVPKRHYSIISKDIRYQISFWYKSGLIVQLDDDYLGSANPNVSRSIYNAFSLPNFNYPMNTLQSVYGIIVLKVEAMFYNMTSNDILSENTVKIQLFIIHPLVKFALFSLITAICSIAVIERSGTTYKVKNIWEKSLTKIFKDFLVVLSMLIFVIGGGILGVIIFGLNVLDYIIGPLNEPIYGTSIILVFIFLIYMFFLGISLGFIFWIFILKFFLNKKEITIYIKKIHISYISNILQKILNFIYREYV